MLRTNFWIAGVILLVGTWRVAPIRPGHDWGDDFSLYIRHAQNVVEGAPYGDTGYIPNPALPTMSPRTYPPVFPLLLAPVYRAFGLNLDAMKMELVLLFLLTLGVLVGCFRRDLPRPWLPSLLLLLGLNPYLWDQKDRILSEVPFLLFTYLSLWLLRESRVEGLAPGRRALLSMLAGLSLYLAYGTRTVGVVLVGSVVCEGILRRRRPAELATVLVPFAGCLAMQRLLLPFDPSYLEQLAFDPGLFARNFLSLVQAFGLFVDNGYYPALRWLLTGLLGLVALVGYIGRVRAGWTVREVFFPLYLAVIAAWPCSAWNQRFLLPLLPLALVYAWQGLVQLASWRPGLERPLGMALGAVILLSYAGQYTRADWGLIREGVAKPESRFLFRFIQEGTPPDAVVVFPKPRALALYTRRRSAAPHPPREDREFWDFLQRVGATHLVVGSVFADSQARLQPFVDRHPANFLEVYANPDFTVYRVLDTLVASDPSRTKNPERQPVAPKDGGDKRGAAARKWNSLLSDAKR